MKGMRWMSENNGEDKKQSSLQRYLYAADKERLRTLLEEMSQIAAASIETAVGALRSGDAVLAEKVIEGDDLIDEKEDRSGMPLFDCDEAADARGSSFRLFCHEDHSRP